MVDEKEFNIRREEQKRAVQWLHEKANSMNNPHAKAILNTAALHFGVFAKRIYQKFQ